MGLYYGEQTYQCPLVVAQTIVVYDCVPLPLTTAFGAFYDRLDFEWLICLIALRKFLDLHELLRRLPSVPGGPPVFYSSSFPNNVNVTEERCLLVIPGKHLIELIVVHVSGFFILLFLVSF